MYNGNYEVASLVYIYMYMYVQKRYFPLCLAQFPSFLWSCCVVSFVSLLDYMGVFCIGVTHPANVKPQALYIERSVMQLHSANNCLTVCSITKVTCIINDRNKVILKLYFKI